MKKINLMLTVLLLAACSSNPKLMPNDLDNIREPAQTVSVGSVKASPAYVGGLLQLGIYKCSNGESVTLYVQEKDGIKKLLVDLPMQVVSIEYSTSRLAISKRILFPLPNAAAKGYKFDGEYLLVAESQGRKSPSEANLSAHLTPLSKTEFTLEHTRLGVRFEGLYKSKNYGVSVDGSHTYERNVVAYSGLDVLDSMRLSADNWEKIQCKRTPSL